MSCWVGGGGGEVGREVGKEGGDYNVISELG